MAREGIPKPKITASVYGDENYITCPFEHDPDGGGLVYDEHPHPRGFLHDYDSCEGIVPLAEYLVWLGQQAGKAYMRP